MTHHEAPGIRPIPCAGRGCRICALITPGSAAHSPAYAALFAAGVPAGPIPAPTLPLAGDLVEALTQRIGADRLAEWVGAKLGVDCGCAGRRARLNELDVKLRRFLGVG